MKKVSRIVCLFLFLFAAWCNRVAADSLDAVGLSQDNSAPQPVSVFNNPYLEYPEMALDNPAIQEALKGIYPDSLGSVSTFEGPVLLGFEDPFFPRCGSDGSDQPLPWRPEPRPWGPRPCPPEPKPLCPEPEPWPWGPRPCPPDPRPWDPWSPYYWYYWRNEGIETILKQPRIHIDNEEGDPSETIMKQPRIRAIFIDPRTNNEKTMKQPWIRIDNEEWDLEKIMKQPWIWHIDWEMIKKIEEIMKQPLYPERPQYIPHTPEQVSRP